MASKRRSQNQRARKQRARKSSGPPTYVLVAAVIVIAIVAVAALAVLDGGRTPSQAGAVATLSEKSLGAQDAPVVVVEYADFQCPYCAQFATGAARQLEAEYIDAGKVRFVFHHLAFLGEESTWAAEASECANAQGRFWGYYDKLFEEQAGENQGAYGRDNLKRFAAELGLDTAQFDECLDTGTYRSVVQDESDQARLRRIDRTPSIVVNGQLIQNGADYQVLKAAVEAALAAQ